MKNGPKWVQNGRQDLRIGPLASPGHFLASGTGPAAQNRQNIAQTPDQPPPAAATGKCADIPLIGVRDLVARGYFIPGGASQRGVGRGPA